MIKKLPTFSLLITIIVLLYYSRIPNSERGREGPSGARKYLEKKIALPEEDISVVFMVALQAWLARLAWL
jgi:hypothetical protein